MRASPTTVIGLERALHFEPLVSVRRKGDANNKKGRSGKATVNLVAPLRDGPVRVKVSAPIAPQPRVESSRTHFAISAPSSQRALAWRTELVMA